MVSLNDKKNLNKFSEVSNFGELLKNTRERHGISLAEVSTDLRVREDILVAIEECDFARIPPQGYSRNMIKSYARLLGLNASKITDMFLDAEYSFQLNKKQASAQKISDENKKRVPKVLRRTNGVTMTPREQIEQRKQESQDNFDSTESSKVSPGARTMHVYGNRYKNSPRARRELDMESGLKRGRVSDFDDSFASYDLLDGDNHELARERLEARRRNSRRVTENPFSQQSSANKKNRSFNRRHKISREESKELSDNENPNMVKSQQRNRSGYQFINIYQKKNNSAQSSLTIPVVAISVVVLVVVLVLVFFFVGKQSENDKTDVSKLNVVGITDIENFESDNNDNEESQESNPVTVNEPKEVEFKYKVVDSSPVYMEIYENDSSRPILAREVKPGETNTFKVTGTLKVVTTRPSAVEFYVADELVTATDTRGSGVYSYTVDFNEYLTK